MGKGMGMMRHGAHLAMCCVYSVCFFSSWPMSKDIRPFGSSVVTSVLFIPDG